MKKKPKSNLLDKAINYLAPSWGMKRQAARTSFDMLTAYRGASQSRLRNDWSLGLEDETADLWELETLRNRARDLNRNDAVASGATDTMGINIVGSGLKPQSHMRARRLGVSEGEAREYARRAEQVFSEWKPFADSGNRLHFDDLQFLALRKIVEDGEILALPVWAKERWRPLQRTVELVECHRLEAADGYETGIRIGKRGEPLTYNIRRGNAWDLDDNTVKIAARDRRGRPKVLHVFRTHRPGQLRGVPYFAPVISLFKDLADYLEAEVVSARVAACLSVFVTKQDAMGYAGAMSDDTETDGSRLQSLEPGMISYLQGGESINVVDPKRRGETFAPFTEGVLRLIGVSLGLPYELLVKDFSKTNYSSARAALLEGRRMFTAWRTWFARAFCQPIYELVLEEAFLRGRFEVPRFYEYKAEYCRAQWVGGAWGWVDPQKEVESSKNAVNYNLSTLAEEAAAQGRDWEEVLEQRAREEKKKKELKLNATDQPLDPGRRPRDDDGENMI